MYGSACIGVCTKEFYAYQLLEAVARADTYRHSHAKWKRDFAYEQEQYTEKLSRMLYDYIVLASYGEARHAYGRCATTIDGVPCGGSRTGSYSKVRAYDPRIVLERTSELFNAYHWSGSFGGKSWGKIANAGLLYGSMPTTAWVDHCVDLCHNTGVAFNKSESGIFGLLTMGNDAYKTFLDSKAVIKPEDFFRKYLCGCSPRFRMSLTRALNLGVCLLPPSCLMGMREHIDDHYVNDSIDKVWSYKPIKWGTKVIGNLKSCNQNNTDSSEGDDDDETQEQEKQIHIAQQGGKTHYKGVAYDYAGELGGYDRKK